MITLWALCQLLLQLWNWDQEFLVPLPPSLLQAYFACEAVSPMIEHAVAPLVGKKSRHSQRIRLRSEDVRRQRQMLRLSRIQIVDSKLYITCPDGGNKCYPHLARTLSLLLRLARLPDVDFLYDESENSCHHTLRKISASKGAQHRLGPVVVVATETADGCEQLLAPPRALGTLPDNARFLARAASHPWETRLNLALFRGKATGGRAVDAAGRPSSMRARAAAFSVLHSDLLDARFAGRGGLGAIEPNEARARNWSDDASYMTWSDTLRYRAQLVLDGNTLPDRLSFILASMTAVLKQESPRRESFHKMMQPYIHFVPVAHNLSNLEQQLKWALSNSSRLHAIAMNGAALALRFMSRNAQICHWLELIEHIANHLATAVKIDPKAHQRVPAPPVIHEPIIRPNSLRPQLTHMHTGLREVLDIISKLHFAPCVAMSLTHWCLDV
eukprot:CAMPEP_0195601360 /NCGR_PEP_ID=MMETSP0815-20121206/5044_1 /TAXON_ID=97485 /ORGANISM="Prymnesium parvum, Strain Texoma1" /LENGTH=442 /DNA_ID=CAMNT_0040740897 /DNA_START=27 /DNA_END=1355 /DNA_ORIENTATION=-